MPNMLRVFRTLKKDLWLVRNYDWLKEHYSGKHVAYCDGGRILAEDSFEKLWNLLEREGYKPSACGLIYVDPKLTRKQVSHGRFL